MIDPKSLVPDDVRERLLALRRDLHRRPELAFKEEKTAQRLADELRRLKPVHLERVAGTGVIARVRGRDREAPVVAVRGDIDALPIQEETGLSYSSEVPGVMHACGHDAHAAWTVGAAYSLSREPAQGDVLIVLQPAEESGRGASAVLESGALDDANVIFGAHADRRYPVGRIVADEGAVAAAADSFTIDLVGRGAHGARPHEGADPIIGVGALIVGLQSIVARRLRPGTPGVVSIGVVNAGTAANIIPERARVDGTLRALDPTIRQLLHREVRRIAQGIADAHDLEARVSIELGPPPIINSGAPLEWVQQASRSLLGPDALAPLGSYNMGGEDFAWYLERLPGCFFRIGAREEGSEFIPAHTSRFYAAEESIFVGAAVLAAAARTASASL